jgi:hypothetical protein
MKSNKKQNKSNKTLLIVMVIALLFIQSVFIVKLRLESQSILKNLAFISLRQVNDTYKSHPIVDAVNKKVYLAGLNLYLPLTVDSADLSYRVTDDKGGGTTDLVFSSKTYESDRGVNNDSNDICSYLVRVEIGANEAKPRAGEATKKPFKLSDGRMAYSYLPENSSTCSQLQYSLAKQAETVVRQLRSY